MYLIRESDLENIKKVLELANDLSLPSGERNVEFFRRVREAIRQADQARIGYGTGQA